MKLKINTKKLWYIVFTIFLIIVLYNIFSYVKPVKSIVYKGNVFTFRDNIKETKKIPIIDSNESYIHDLFWDPSIDTVKTLFQPNTTQLGYYSLEVAELSYKLSFMYLFENDKKEFIAEPIESYDNITTSANELKLVLIHPNLTNETYIKAEKNIIYIAGKDLKDFDLATIKVILIAMDYKV